MAVAALSMARQDSDLLRPILVGGFVAGTLDLTAAFVTLGAGSPRVIAAGLIGLQAVRTGIFPWILGVLLHYFIAFSAATIYCVASRKLRFLREHWLVCGMFYGIAIFLVMNLVVLPLCAFHYTGPYKLHGMLQGILIHMFLIGVPISFSLRRLSR